MDDEITINCPNHHQNLIDKLWNCFLSCFAVDFNVQGGDGRSVRAHRLILDQFLSPEKLNQSVQKQRGSPIELLVLEFLYKGEVTVPREELETLLKVARESEFQLLVDVLESRFPEYFVKQNKDDFVAPLNEVLPDAGNSFALPHNCNWQVTTVKSEPPDVIPYHLVESDMTSDHNNEPDNQLSSFGHLGTLQRTCDEPVTQFNVGLPLSIQSHKQASSMMEELDGNSEFDGLLPDALTNYDPSCGVTAQDVPVPEQTPNRFEVQVGNINVQVEADYVACTSQIPSHTSINSKVTEYTCSECGKQFRGQLSKFVVHMRSHTKERPFSCDICKRSYLQKHHLTQHLKGRGGKHPFQCQQCLRVFCDQERLTNHRRTHDDDNISYHCEEADCSAAFPTPEALSVHQSAQHLDESTEHQCHLCARTFQLHSRLNRHLSIHHGKPNVMRFKCDVCHKGFSSRDSLKTHSQRHTSEIAQFECSICHKSFSNKNYLKQHQHTHGIGDKFTCDVCSKVFYTVHQLNDHSRVHTGEKPYQCTECPKAFSRPGILQVHLRLHTGERPFHCDQEGCDLTFRQIGELVYHKLKHARNKPYKCPEDKCTRAFYSRAELTLHSRYHAKDRPFACKQCGMSFLSLVSVKRHVSRMHTDRIKHKCDICGESFSKLKEHVSRKHSYKKDETNEKDDTVKQCHKCDICEESFADLENLNLHATTHV